MDSSPSPSHLDASNSADKAGETMLIDGQAPFPPFPSLLDLPDELLSAIYRHVYHAFALKHNPLVCGLVAPLPALVVNKRIFAVAKPIWLQHLVFTESLVQNDVLISHLFVHPELHPYIQSVDMELSYEATAIQTTLLALFKNVHRLSIEGSAHGEYIPPCVTAALKKLSKLRHLTFNGSEDFDTFGSFVETDLPSLRSFKTNSSSLLDSLLTSGVCGLQRIVLQDHYLGPSKYPWASLRSLELGSAAGGIGHSTDLEEIFDEGWDYASPPPSLERLVLRACSHRPGSDLVFWNGSLEQILGYVRSSTTLRVLELSGLSCIRWPLVTPLVPSFRQLSLKGTIRLYEKDYLRSLHNFLQTFPSLTLLTIESFLFANDSLNPADILTACSSSELIVRYPILFALLSLLESTPVLDVWFRETNNKREVRWKRTRKERFGKEGWSL